MAEPSVLVSTEQYAALLIKLNRMPPRKRKNFKSFLHDKHGVRTRVIYKDEKFWNYSASRQRFEVVCAPQHFTDEEMKAVTKIGEAILENPELHAEIMDKVIDVNSTNNHNPNRNPVQIPCPRSNR